MYVAIYIEVYVGTWVVKCVARGVRGAVREQSGDGSAGLPRGRLSESRQGGPLGGLG